MKPAPFDLHRPTSIDQALDLLQAHGDEAKVLAGGQSLMPVLAMRLAVPTQLVDLDLVDELRGIERANGHVRVGAMTRHADLPRHEAVASHVPLLARAVPLVGHIAIRNRGTIGGALAHADPAAEYPAVCVALGATMELVGPGGTRDVPADDFFESTFTTALEPDELLRAIRLPVAPPRSGAAVLEVARRHGDFALAGVACTVELGADDRIRRAGLALFGVASRPWRAEAAEAALVGQAADVDLAPIAQLAVQGLDPAASIHASTEYLQHVAAVLTGRALRQAIEEALAVAEHDITVEVNGAMRSGRVESRRTLADWLRDDLALTGTHLGCEHGACGACTVLIDGDSQRACLVLAAQADGRRVTTVEGIGEPDGRLSPVQDAFRQCHGLQCGFCTPGFVTTVTAFLADNPSPTDDEIRDALSGNLCRCTGYQGIVAAVRLAAETGR